jgi:ABC-2 type transport system permease protein
MKRLRFYIELYFMMMSQYIKARMQFRTDFYISAFAILLLNITGIFSFWILFKSIKYINGWSFFELMFFYSFALLAMTPQQLFFDNLWIIRNKLRDGSFIKYYFKPINTLFYYVSEVFDIKGLGQLGLAISLLVYSSIKLGISWNLYKIVTFLVLIFSSSLIMISLMIMAASVAFWVIDSAQVLVLVFKMGDFARYPVTIFNRFFRILFTGIIPIAFISYYPSRFFLRTGQYDMITFITPFVGVILFIIAYALWKKGLNSYSGTGS